MSRNAFAQLERETNLRQFQQEEAARERAALPPRFANVFCSQCGADFGPGDHGFSDCRSHRRPRTPQRTPQKT